MNVMKSINFEYVYMIYLFCVKIYIFWAFLFVIRKYILVNILKY